MDSLRHVQVVRLRAGNFAMSKTMQQLQSDPRWQRLDRQEDSLMAISIAETIEPGSTGIGVDLDSIHDQLEHIHQQIGEIKSND